jgi:hypothetical protein
VADGNLTGLVVYVLDRAGAGLDEAQRLLRLQVDAALHLGWAPDRLLFLTDFPFAWQGVSSEVIGPPERPRTARATSFYKTWCIRRALDRLGPGDALWYHDADAYPLARFTAPPTGRAFSACLYSTRERLLIQGGSLFLTADSRPVFEWVWDALTRRGCRKDEFALTDAMAWPEHAGLFALMDSSYNLGTTDFELRYQLAELPVKVAHFHPDRPSHRRVFVEARNGLGVDPLPPWFRSLLVDHGFAPPELAVPGFQPTLERRQPEYVSTSGLAGWLGRVTRG